VSVFVCFIIAKIRPIETAENARISSNESLGMRRREIDAKAGNYRKNSRPIPPID
jgi:hypothetical protein